MDTDRRSKSMKLEIALVAAIAGVWAVLAATYALAPWPGMIGYAWVWGLGAILFTGLAIALARAAAASPSPGGIAPTSPKENQP